MTTVKAEEPHVEDTYDERDSDRLRRMTSREFIGVELASAFAGDREMTSAEHERMRVLHDTGGAFFFADLLHSIAHIQVAPGVAQGLWYNFLAHKKEMSESLGRKVPLTVAALDYLSALTSEMKSLTLISEGAVRKMADESVRDGMTGLFNHATCYELLNLEVRRHLRYGIGVSVILLDVDDFKALNDRHGHQAGDGVLNELAAVMQEHARDTDICCRFGGDEFAIILPFTNDATLAEEIAGRIRNHAAVPTPGRSRITVSTGVATTSSLRLVSASALIRRADRALYGAKRRKKLPFKRARFPLSP